VFFKAVFGWQNDTLNSESQDMILPWRKTIWRNFVFLHVAIVTDGCNLTSRRNFLAGNSEAKIVSMVSVHCHAHRLASAS